MPTPEIPPGAPWSESVGMNLPGWAAIALMIATLVVACLILWWSP